VQSSLNGEGDGGRLSRLGTIRILPTYTAVAGIVTGRENQWWCGLYGFGHDGIRALERSKHAVPVEHGLPAGGQVGERVGSQESGSRESADGKEFMAEVSNMCPILINIPLLHNTSIISPKLSSLSIYPHSLPKLLAAPKGTTTSESPLGAC
jgi:hypothetical protein